MTKLLEEYNAAKKADCSIKLMGVIIAFVIPACMGWLIKSFNLFGASNIAFFISVLGDCISFMVPIIVTTKFSISKYTMFIVLPIRAKSIIGFIYLQTYIILISSSLISGVINSFSYGIGFFFMELLKLSFLLLLSNLIIPFIISPQMDSATNQNNVSIVLIITLIIIGFCSGITATFSIIGKITLYIGSNLFIWSAGGISIIFFINAYVTVRWSFNKSANKVRLVQQ